MKKCINKICLILIFLFVFIIPLYTNAAESDTFYVGYGAKDISPMESFYTTSEKTAKSMPKVSNCSANKKAINPIPLGGYGTEMLRAKDTQCIDDDSHIKTTVVAFKDNSDNYVILLSIDFSGMPSSVTNKSGFDVNTIRSGIINYVKQNLGITLKENRIMLSSTHNHSGPAYKYDNDGIRSYITFVQRRMNEAVNEALSNMKKATITYDTLEIFLDANGKVQDANYNKEKKRLNLVRHYTTNNFYTPSGKELIVSSGHGKGYKCNGTGRTNCDEDFSKLELKDHSRDADYDMQVLKIDFNDGKTTPILMLNWQAHPNVQGSGTSTIISADFIGYLRGYLEPKYNVSYYQGAAGDIHTRSYVASDSFIAAEYDKKYSVMTDATGDSNSKTAVKIIGKKLGEIIKTRIDSGQFFKKKVEYKNGIVFYQENGKTESQSNRINMRLRRWTDKDSNGNNLYNVDIYANAYFIKKVWAAAESDLYKGTNNLKRIINGDYTLAEWKDGWNYKEQNKSYDFRFPKYFTTKTNDEARAEVSKKLLSLIFKYNSKFFSNMYILKEEKGVTKLDSYKNFKPKPVSELLAVVGTLLDDTKTPLNESVYQTSHASVLFSTYERTKEYATPILNTFAIGNIGFVTAPYEMFSSNGKSIKTNSPYNMTFILAYSNGGYYGYVPDRDTFGYQSYETDITLFVEGTAEDNADTLVSRLKQINNKVDYQKGDVDGNGKVGSSDYVLVRKHILKQTTLTGDKLKRADANGDGKVNSLDFVAIRKIIINKK